MNDKEKTPEAVTQESNLAFTVRPRPGKERWAYLSLEESRKRNAELARMALSAEASTHDKDR